MTASPTIQEMSTPPMALAAKPVNSVVDRNGIWTRMPDQVAADGHPVESAVATAVAFEQRRDVVVAVAQHVVVDQVDRGPRDQDAQQQRQEVGVVGQEVVGADQRRDQGDRRTARPR